MQHLLADLLERRLLVLLEAGTIRSGRVRAFRVVLSRDGGVVRLAARHQWDGRWPLPPKSQALDELALTELSGVLPSGLDARLALVSEALRLVATRPSLQELPRLPVFVLGAEGRDGGCRPVAFCHPRGAGDLVRATERRAVSAADAGDSPGEAEDPVALETWVSLSHDGITLFFPRGEGEAYSESDMRPVARVVSFATMQVVYVDAAEAVRVHTTERVQPWVLDVSDAREGGSAAKGLLLAHLGRSGALFEAHVFPFGAEAADVERWLAQYEVAKPATAASIVAALVDRHGIQAVPAFVDRLVDGDDKHAGMRAFAEELVAAERYAEALRVLELVGGRRAMRGGALRAQALCRLGRHAEAALAFARLPARLDQDHEDEWPWVAMALAQCGRADDLRALLERANGASGSVKASLLYAQAFAAKAEPAAAAALLYAAFATGFAPAQLSGWQADFADAQALAPLFEQRRRLELQQEALWSEMERASIKTAVAALKGAPSKARVTCRLEAKAIAGAPTETLGGLCVHAGRLYASTRDAMHVLDLAAQTMRSVAIAGGRLGTPALVQGFLYVADERKALRVLALAADGLPESVALDAPCLFAHGDGGLAAQGALVALDGGTLWDASRPEAPELVAAVGRGIKAATFHGHHLIVSRRETIALLDVSVPSSPRLVGAISPLPPQMHDCWMDPEELLVLGDVLFASVSGYDGSATWLIDVSDPKAPRSIGALPCGGKLFAYDETTVLVLNSWLGRLYEIDVTDLAGPQMRPVHVDGASEGVRGLYADGRLFLHKTALSIFRVETVASAAVAPEPAVDEPRVDRRQLAQSQSLARDGARYFASLAQDPGAEDVLRSLMRHATRVTDDGSVLVVHFFGDGKLRWRCTAPAAARFERWPPSFQAIVRCHERLELFDDQYPVVGLGDSLGCVDWDFDETGLEDLVAEGALLAPMVRFGDLVVYHPSETLADGEPALAPLRPEDVEIGKPLPMHVGSLFLEATWDLIAAEARRRESASPTALAAPSTTSFASERLPAPLDASKVRAAQWLGEGRIAVLYDDCVRTFHVAAPGTWAQQSELPLPTFAAFVADRRGRRYDAGLDEAGEGRLLVWHEAGFCVVSVDEPSQLTLVNEQHLALHGHGDPINFVRAAAPAFFAYRIDALFTCSLAATDLKMTRVGRLYNVTDVLPVTAGLVVSMLPNQLHLYENGDLSARPVKLFCRHVGYGSLEPSPDAGQVLAITVSPAAAERDFLAEGDALYVIDLRGAPSVRPLLAGRKALAYSLQGRALWMITVGLERPEPLLTCVRLQPEAPAIVVDLALPASFVDRQKHGELLRMRVEGARLTLITSHGMAFGLQLPDEALGALDALAPEQRQATTGPKVAKPPAWDDDRRLVAALEAKGAHDGAAFVVALQALGARYDHLSSAQTQQVLGLANNGLLHWQRQGASDLACAIVEAALALAQRRSSAHPFYAELVGNMLAIAEINRQDALLRQVLAKMLPAEAPSARLLYNIASAHAFLGDREAMLAAVATALERGRTKAQFLADAAFAAFRRDPDFLAVLDGASRLTLQKIVHG